MQQQEASAQSAIKTPWARAMCLGTLGGCVLLLALFAVMAWTAVRTKSITYDETLHVPAAFVEAHELDFRANFEHPPLWKYWAALGQRRDALNLGSARETFNRILENDSNKWAWAKDVLYHTPATATQTGNDAQAIVMRSRAMMLVLGVLLGALMGFWAWCVGGAVAAVVTMGFFCFDPNFLAHSPLVTNDVAFTLMITLIMFNVWRVGRRATAGRLLLLLLAIAVAVNVKFTALLLGPIIALLLFMRALMGGPWEWMGFTMSRKRGRVGASLAFCLVAMLVTYAAIWASYGFRFAATPGTGPALNTSAFARGPQSYTIGTNGGGDLNKELDAFRRAAPSATARALLFLEDHHLFPQAWTAGMVYSHAYSMFRSSFENGNIKLRGSWYYFPMAMAFKEPVATLVAMVGAAALFMGIAARHVARRRSNPQPGMSPGVWTAACLIIPLTGYLVALMASHLNIGYRHALPLMPFILVGIGVAASVIWQMRAHVGRLAIIGLGLALLAESAQAWPDYIPFFNTMSGGARGGIRLLGDSNIDWGQDLIALAKWQNEHPGPRLFLQYFGTADPKFYGIRYFDPNDEKSPPMRNGDVAAVSVMQIQLYVCSTSKAPFASLSNLDPKPKQVLGGSIYLFWNDENDAVSGHPASK